jgi:TetR/AcrR family transcriptional regulator, transcriptional repressor of bet genes
MVMRRTFQRQPEDVRRRELIDAALECIAELGLQGATVREVALRAGVTPGLIRRYFATKENLIVAAYRKLSDAMAEAVDDAVGEGSPELRLARFIRASLTPPVVDQKTLSLWAAFISAVHNDPAIDAVHAEGYANYRARIETLIGEIRAGPQGLPKPNVQAMETAHKRATHGASVAINALLDGLWLELSLSPDAFAAIDVVALAQQSAAAILGISMDKFTEQTHALRTNH